MTRLLPTLLLSLLPGTAIADVPNIFQPKKTSSSAITAGVITCMASAKKNNPGHPPRLWVKYCGCTVDAMRKWQLKTGKADAKISEMKRCGAWAQKVQSIQRPSISPFGPTPWSSERIFSGVIECERSILRSSSAKEKAKKRWLAAELRCACMVDAARAKKTKNFQLALKKVTKKEHARCAKWVQAYLRRKAK